jgi:hypothetical protein
MNLARTGIVKVKDETEDGGEEEEEGECPAKGVMRRKRI